MKQDFPFGRLAAVVLAALLLLQPLCVQAASAPVITADAVTANAGEDVSVVLKLANNSGVNALKLNIDYNGDVFTLLSVTDANLFGSSMQSPNLSDRPYSIVWASAGNVTANGELVELRFHVSETAQSGVQPIEITVESAFNEAEQPVSVTTQNASVAVIGRPAASIFAEPVSAQAGQDVTVELQLADNAGVNALHLQIDYNSEILTLLSVTDANLFGSPMQSPNLSDRPYSIVWASANNVTVNGELVELRFHISETAQSGTQTIRLTVESAFNASDEEVLITAYDAAVTVEEPPVTEIKSVTATAAAVSAAVSCAQGDSAKALCAQYDAAGKLLSVQTKPLTAGTENTLSFARADGAATAKIFVLDSTAFTPLCPAQSARFS